MAAKKYYWLKLKNTYFRQLEQKKMRKQESGKDMQIIYLKMMLCSLDKNGYIYYQGVYDTLEEELAEEFDEDVDMVKKTMDFLIENRMISINDEVSEVFIREAVECIGSECDSAGRVREFRKREKMLHCNEVVTQCNTEKEKEIELEKENRVDYQLIADMYNATCVSFPKLTKLSEKRKKAIKARLKTYTVDDFKKLFELAEGSSFLKGQNNRNWSATFDWLIADANMAKVLDGNYTDNSSSYRNATRQQASDYANSDNYSVYREMYRNLTTRPDDPFQ